MPSKRKITANTTTIADPDNSTPTTANDSGAASAPTPATKRRRVSRACDQCRAAREKCDGIQPLCFPCASQNRPCTYAANPKKRGVQTGYIKTLEVALAWLFEKVPGCEEALENLLLHEGGQGQSLLVGKESDKAKRLHKRWRRSKVHKEIDRILSGGDAAQSRADKSSPLSDDESEAEHSEKTTSTLPNSTPAHVASQNGPATSSTQGLNIPTSTRNIIKLPSNHWRLVDIYFSYTHCWYPILEKQDLLKTVYTYPEAGLDVQQLGAHPAAHAELWAAMSLAAYQDAASASPQVAVHGTPSLLPDEIYSVARKLVPTEEGNFEIQHARALLLLALINVGKGKKTSAWILVGLAHRIALDVSELHPNDERSSRRTTAMLMGCYILDTLISVHRRGMPSLETAGVIEGMSIPEDNLDEWQPWTPCEGFGPTSRTTSRSPAYSLTTFNQVYDVFKFMRKRTLQRQNGLVPAEHPSEAMTLLHQTIKPGLPFARFIVARDSSSVSIPSAYVLRILFLWVGATLDSTDESPCILILESIEQYLAQFGACGAPPFFASCLVMMRQYRGFDDLPPQSRERWQTIQDTLIFTWTRSSDKCPVSAAVSSIGTVPSAPIVASASAQTATNLNTTPSSDAVRRVPAPLAMQTPNHVSNRYSLQPSRPFAMPVFSPSVKPHAPPPQSLDHTACSGHMNMFDDHHNHMIHPGHQDGLPVGPPRELGGRPPGIGNHRESFGGGSLDYDALLDDLSLMDYTDRVDADPQFMANLGFAPGCDVSEILSREFGAI